MKSALGIILVLAVGISLVTTIFSVTYTVLWAPLPYPYPDRIVQVSNQLVLRDGFGFGDWFQRDQFLSMKEQTRAFQKTARFTFREGTVLLAEQPERMGLLEVDPTFFSILGASFELGQPFGEEEVDSFPVILTYPVWASRFGLDANIIGRTFRIGSYPYHVVGVLNRDFFFDYRNQNLQLFVPIQSQSEVGSQVLARLAGGISGERAEEELQSYYSHRDGGTTESATASILTPLLETQTARHRPTLLTLLGAVGFLFLIACANSANLILLSGLGRTCELATRSALGASRLRLARMLLAEGLLFGFAAGVVASLIGYWMIGFFIQLTPTPIPRLEQAGFSPLLLAVILALSITAGVLGSAGNLLHLGWTSSWSRLRGNRGSHSPKSHRLRSALVIAEVSLAIILAAGCVLAVRSFLTLSGTELGFEEENLLTWRIALPEQRYPDLPEKTLFIERLLEHLLAVPGLDQPSVAGNLPLTQSLTGQWLRFPAGQQPPGFTGNQTIPGFGAQPDAYVVNIVQVGPGYFQTLDIPLSAGRYLNRQDRTGAPDVAVISRRMAQELWGSSNPVGRRMISRDREIEVVGVVSDLRYMDASSDYLPTVYLPYRQFGFFRPPYFLARTRVDPDQLMPQVKQVVRNLDSELAVTELRTMEDLHAETLARPRYFATLFSTFAAVALSLAAVGLYGVLSHTVTHRTREIGVRRALGAGTIDVFRLVLRPGLLLVAIGGILGAGGVLALFRLVESLISQAQPDWLTGVLILFAGVGIALLALCGPCFRAARVDPVQALRHH